MSTESAAPPLRLVLVAAAAAVATGALVAVSNGNLLVALAPAIVVAAGVWVLRAPLGTLATLVLFAGLLFDNVAERPGMGLFKTPLYAPGTLLYTALSSSLRIPGMKVFGLELLVVGIAVVAVMRGPSRREASLPRPASALMWASAVASGACLLWEAWGIASGGDLRFSMLQFRPLLFACALPALMAFCLREPRWIRGVLAACFASAVVRNAFGIYYWWAIIRHGVKGSTDLGGGTYVLTHSDSILAATVLIAVIVMLYERPTLRAWALAAVVFPVVGFGMMVNNRRLAIVGMVIALGFIYLLADRRLRRRVHLTVLALIPVAVLYIGAGWSSDAAWARPVRTIRSVLVKSDSSAQTRDVENYNLYFTIKQKPLLGYGFGHEYIERVRMFDISTEFEAYLYVPHNSVLFLFSAVGPLGFALINWLLVAIVFLAARTYRSPRAGPEDRVLSLVTVGVTTCYGVQAFGDMGYQSWMGALLLAAFGGLVANAAVRTGAWPEARR